MPVCIQWLLLHKWYWIEQVNTTAWLVVWFLSLLHESLEEWAFRGIKKAGIPFSKHCSSKGSHWCQGPLQCPPCAQQLFAICLQKVVFRACELPSSLYSHPHSNSTGAPCTGVTSRLLNSLFPPNAMKWEIASLHHSPDALLSSALKKPSWRGREEVKNFQRI